MTPTTGLASPQHLPLRAVGELTVAAQSAPGPQIPPAVQAAIGAYEPDLAPSLQGRVAPQAVAAPLVQPPVAPEILEAIQRVGGVQFLRDNEGLRNDHAIVLAAVTQNSEALVYASPRLGNDRDIVLAAVTQNGGALRSASEGLRNDHAIVLAAVTQNGGALVYASEGLRNDPVIVLAAVTQNGEALVYASPRLRNNHDIVLAAVTQNGVALRYASEGLRNHPTIVLAAVTQNGLVLERISEALRTIEIASAAVAQNPAARQWVPAALIASANAQINTNPAFLPFVDPALITYEIAQAAIKLNPLLLRFVPAEILARLELEVLTSAVRTNPAALNLIDPVILREYIVNTVIQMNIDPTNVSLLAARQAALRSLADKVLDGTIGNETARAWMPGLARYFCDDKVFMIFAITHFGLEALDASSQLRLDPDIIAADARVTEAARARG
ncbi:MAG: DUF4116 domain-containing protein [Chlamydiae bacterium]|nr:DUF4116 domain-containing protein [Chlamydiota bacterium]